MNADLQVLARRLTERDWAILADVERFRLLSTRHIQQLHFGEGHASVLAATRGTVRVLGRLEGHGLLARLERRIGGARQGSSGSVWQLAAAGERLLRSQRGDRTRRRFVEPSPTFTEHTLQVASVAVDIITAARAHRFELLRLEAEPQCWRLFVNAAGSQERLRPDLFVVVADEEFETRAFIEVDRSTEHLPVIIRKQGAYERYFRTGREQAEAGVFPAIVWLTQGEGRIERMRSALASYGGLLAAYTHVAALDAAEAVLAGESVPITADSG